MNTTIGMTEANKDFPFMRWLSELEALSASKSVELNIQFLSDCCARQYGNYVRFVSEVGWGDPSLVCRAINFLRNFSPSVAGVTSDEAEQLRAALDGIAPDTEVFASAYTSAALDAIGCIIEALEYCVDHKSGHCVQAACLCRDTVYMFVQQRDNLDYSDVDEAKIYQDPLMERELAAQQNSMSSSKGSSDRTRDEVLPARDCDAAQGSLFS